MMNTADPPPPPTTIHHLSVGDVLRAERDRPRSPYVALMKEEMEQGRIGPVGVTVGVLRAERPLRCFWIVWN